ncbi:MAG: GGDEF domain-containing protein [Acidimicrobiales bacterium]
MRLDGALVAAYLLFGKVPDGYDVTTVYRNVVSRVRRLIEATALLMARCQSQDRLIAAATRDPLTGLANRDAFADALAASADVATLLYIDVDRFKAVNDRHGHDVGDRALVEVARRIVDASRPDDIVARFGGDEFVVLLNGVDIDQGRVIGERIVDAVAAPLEGLAALKRPTVTTAMPIRGAPDHVPPIGVSAVEPNPDRGHSRLHGA